MKPGNGQNKALPGLNDQITRMLSRHLGAYNGCRVPNVAPWINCPLEVKMIASAKNRHGWNICGIGSREWLLEITRVLWSTRRSEMRVFLDVEMIRIEKTQHGVKMCYSHSRKWYLATTRVLLSTKRIEMC